MKLAGWFQIRIQKGVKRPLLTFGVTVLTGIVVVLAGCKDGSERTIAVEGYAAPGFELKDVSGNTWNLSDMRGSVVLINFWASWCKSCKEEMPSLQRLYEKTKNDPGFHLVTILYKDDPMKAYAYMVKNNYGFPLLVDPAGSASVAYGLTGVPETFLVGKKGILRKKVIGPVDFDSPGVNAYLKRLVEE